MSAALHLSLSSTLDDLPLQEAQVSADVMGGVVAETFEQQPTLSGVLVLEHGATLAGVISRRQLQYELGQSFADVFLKRPLRSFLDQTPDCTRPLILPYDTPIAQAAKRCLERPPSQAFEPVVVEFQHPEIPDLNSYFLLDCHTLLLAHSDLLHIACEKVQQSKDQLQREQRRVKTYTTRLDVQRTELQESQGRIEQQRQQLLDRTEEIQVLHQRLKQIGTVLNHEGQKMFKATFAGVDVICQNTDQVTTISHLLEAELETIDTASALIERVSRQVRQLSLQAAIAINKQTGSDVSGFGYVVQEIGSIINQTRETGRQMRVLADRFRQRVAMFTVSAQSGTSVARSLIRDADQAMTAFTSIERLGHEQGLLEQPISGQPTSLQHREILSLRQKLAEAETNLSHLHQTIMKHSR